jgi:hypothetical protein
MSEGRRGGERRRHARPMRMHPTQARDIVACARGRVLRSVLRPVHVDPHYAPQAQASEVGRRRRHHGWANPRKREEPALGSSPPDVARLAACPPLPRGRGRGTSEEEGDRGLRPCEDQAEPGLGCPHVVNAVAEVGRRRQVSNKLGNAPQKRRSGSSEQGPSSGRGSAGDTVGRHVERTVRREVGLTAKDGRGSAQDPG